jgi:hypothetical protein
MAERNASSKGKRKLKIYLIGSLRNPEVPKVAKQIRELGFDVFDDWYAAGPHADDHWRDYEKARGHSYIEGLKGYAAKHVYEFDLKHLLECDIAVLLMPAGKSAHLELGFVLGIGHAFKRFNEAIKGRFYAPLLKPFLDLAGRLIVKMGYIVLNPKEERWDVMYQFADEVFENVEQLKEALLRLRDQS